MTGSIELRVAFLRLFFMDPELVPHVIDLAKVAL